MKNEIYSVLIIGAGNMGAFFDTPESDNILSHAHGFSKHPGFKLIGFIDSDLKRAQKAAEIWGCKAFSDIREALSQNEIDIVCIAVSDEYHHSIIKELSNYFIKFIFAEKPLAKTIIEAEEIKQIFKNSSISIGINYSRRYVKEFISLKEDISNLKYGEYITGSAYYGKGILHNGSHIIDLIRFLLGEITSSKSIDGCFDFYNDDPSITAIINFQNGKHLFVQHVDCRFYTVFELEFFFTMGKIRIINSGNTIEVYNIVENQIYKGYKNINKSFELNTSLNNAVYSALDNIHDYLAGKSDINCNLQDGLRAVEICNALKDEYQNSL